MNGWQLLFQFVLTPAAVAAVIGYLGQKLFTRLLDRDAKRYAQQLQSFQFEHQTRFAWAHRQQCEVISSLYAKLGVAHKAMRHMIDPVQAGDVDRNAQRVAAANAYNSLEEFFVPNRLFLSEGTAQRVDAVITEMRRSFNLFQLAQGPQGNAHEWLDIWNRIEQDVPALLTALRQEFRTAIGVADPPA